MPQVLAGVDGTRTRAAARFLASRMALARAHAVARGASVALHFTVSGADVTFAAYADGDGDGVRNADIAAGIDHELEPPARLPDLFPGVAFGLMLDDGAGDPLQIGAGNLLSFSPSGTASPGTLYIRGRGGAQYAVRVLGATARTRVLRYDASRGEFVEIY